MRGQSPPGKGYSRDNPRERRHFRGPYQRQRVQPAQLKPMPIGDRCNPLCPFFRCSKNALVTVNKVVRGHVQKAAMCRLIGDQCLGYSCQFAYCERKALLPDGRCAFAVKFKGSGDEFLKEVEKESLEEDVMSLIKRRVGHKENLLE